MRRVWLICFALVLLGFLGYTIYLLRSHPDKRSVQGVDILMHNVAGLEPFMGEEDVRQELGRKGLHVKGLPIDSVDVGAIERKMRENPLFSDVEVYMARGTARVKVEVKQKNAAFRVQPIGGRDYYVSTERGVIPLNPNYSVYVPIVTGYVSEQFATTEVYDLLQVLQGDDYLRNYFGQIHVDDKGAIILSPRLGNTPVLLGTNRDFASMLHKYKVFVREVLPRTGDDAYAYIKLAYQDQVVARPRAWTSEAEPTE